MGQHDRDYLDDKLNTAVPATPVAGSLNDFLSKAAGGNTFDKATDSLEAIADDVASVQGGLKSTTTAGTIVQDATTGTPTVIEVVSSATANTFGSSTALDASASADSWLCGFTVSLDGATCAAPARVDFCIEIQTGASPATKIRYSGSYGAVGTPAAEWLVPIVVTLPIPIKVASGTAIAARASTATADAMTFVVGLSMYQGLET